MKLLETLTERPWHTRGAQYFRMLAGATLLYQILILYAQRGFVYGPGGWYPYDTFAAGFGVVHFSPLALNSSPQFFELFFHLAALAVLAWTAGLWTRLLTPLIWFSLHSLHARMPGLWDGGDNAMAIILIYACFMDLRPRRADAPPPGRLSNLLHNFGILACTGQVILIYSVAGIVKLAGKYWTNGTAFYYVLRSGEFGVTGLGPWIWNKPLLLAALSWAPVLMQLSFPWLCLFGRPAARRVLILAAISFHTGIFVLMGLETFAMYMIAAELLLLSDTDYQHVDRLAARVAALLGRGWALGRQLSLRTVRTMDPVNERNVR